MKYQLKSTLTTEDNYGYLSKNEYLLSLIVNKLREVGQNTTIYDKELKIYFEDQSALATIYELEIDHAYLNVDKQLEKAKDLIRRTFYRYDWMQIRVSRQGKILAVENGEEMLSQWEDIRTLLLADYSGRQVAEYIRKIDYQMAKYDFLTRPITQYIYFGLLFPTIPLKHSIKWHCERIVELSEWDNLQFSENIKFEQTDSSYRKYIMSGTAIGYPDCNLNKYAGYMIVPYDDIHPVEAQIEVSYNNGDMNINWSFNLKKD